MKLLRRCLEADYGRYGTQSCMPDMGIYDLAEMPSFHFSDIERSRVLRGSHESYRWITKQALTSLGEDKVGPRDGTIAPYMRSRTKA